MTAAQILYGDILFMERPSHNGDSFSLKHPKMTTEHRAKIFAPFAALNGFEEHVRSKEIPYVMKRELDADEEWALNRKLCILHALTLNSRLARLNHVMVTVEYYIPCSDPNHDAYGRMGLYKTVTGMVRRVDAVNQTLTVDACTIPFIDIFDIRMEDDNHGKKECGK